MPPVAEHDALPNGTRLSEFEIERVLGVGGFGIVYLAFDHALQRQVAIKEYMPAALAARGQGTAQVSLRSANHAETFALGLRSFINEARLLARFDHPALVKVYRFWEEHGTAYMVMPYYRGQTVQNARREMTVPPDETWLRQLIEPVLGALECLHREQVFHRDIAPDNILLLDEGGEDGPRPVLLDLGAARHVIGGQTQSLTAILKPSFAPIEQYAETVQLRQGAWTDLYALAAVVYFCITGRPPTPATARAVHDDLDGLGQMSEGLARGFDRVYSSSFVNAVDHALAVRPQDRPDSISAWRQELSGIVNVGLPGSTQGDGWVAQTVLVRPASGEKPAGHEAVEARAFLTTIPAASTLKTRPKWPITVAGRKKALAPAQAPGLEPDVSSPVPLWRKPWVMGGAVVALVMSVGLWAQRHPARTAAIEAPVAAATAKTAAAGNKSGNSGKDKSPLPTAKAPSATVAAAATSRKQRGNTSMADATPSRQDGRSDNAEPLSPKQACGSKVFIALAICMKRHCSRPAYAGHAECQRMLEQEEAQHPYP
jgi:serine/threonine protein kinase